MNINVGAATCRPLFGVIGVAGCLFLVSCAGSDNKTQKSADDATPVVVVLDDADKSDFTETGGGVDMEMIFVEGGQFTMGCTPEQGDECDDDEKPAHLVTVGDFYIGKHEVTQRQ